jgi:predicted nucleic acid-binding Zn ribbon protein
MAQRKISRPAVIFKGSGFYSTDNRSKSTAQETPSVDTPSNGSSKPDKATDSKVEAAVD